MKHYTLDQVERALGIDDVTLWRWLRAAHIKPLRDPGDWRRRRLSQDQLIRLARRHHRLVMFMTEESRVDDLEARVFVLEQEVIALSQQVSSHEQYLDPLGLAEDLAEASIKSEVDAILASLRARRSKM
jgi:predicted site-specific integrase-resolvase